MCRNSPPPLDLKSKFFTELCALALTKNQNSATLISADFCHHYKVIVSNFCTIYMRRTSGRSLGNYQHCDSALYFKRKCLSVFSSLSPSFTLLLYSPLPLFFVLNGLNLVHFHCCYLIVHCPC